jgi:hypothetical protein
MPAIRDRSDILNRSDTATATAAEEVSPPLPIISEQQVVFGTAAATRAKRLEAPPDSGWVTRLARRITGSRDGRPPRTPYPAQYEFIADARMDREMYRL